MAQWTGRKFHAGFGWVPKLNIVTNYYYEDYVYRCCDNKGGYFESIKFAIKLGVVPSASTMKDLLYDTT